MAMNNVYDLSLNQGYVGYEEPSIQTAHFDMNFQAMNEHISFNRCYFNVGYCSNMEHETQNTGNSGTYYHTSQVCNYGLINVGPQHEVQKAIRNEQRQNTSSKGNGKLAPEVLLEENSPFHPPAYRGRSEEAERAHQILDQRTSIDYLHLHQSASTLEKTSAQSDSCIEECHLRAPVFLEIIQDDYQKATLHGHSSRQLLETFSKMPNMKKESKTRMNPKICEGKVTISNQERTKMKRRERSREYLRKRRTEDKRLLRIPFEEATPEEKEQIQKAEERRTKKAEGNRLSYWKRKEMELHRIVLIQLGARNQPLYGSTTSEYATDCA